MRKPLGTIRALIIIRDHPITAAKQFAYFMWPDSPGWARDKNNGNNRSVKGGAMAPAGGRFLAKLEKRGLIRVSFIQDGLYVLTDLGKQFLEDNNVV